MPLSKAEFAQVLSGLPADATPEQIDAAAQQKVQQKQGQEGGLWERLNAPLTTLPSQLGKATADKIDTRSLDQSPNMARLKGFFAGASEGAGDLLSSMSSPLNLATMGAGFGATGAAKAGLMGLSKGARAAELALQAPMIAQGAHQVATGKDATEKGMGIAQMAGGVTGMHGALKRPYTKPSMVKGYHGTPSASAPAFTERQTPQGELRHWIHFADDPEIGAAYAGDGGTVVEGNLDIKQPLDATKPLPISAIKALQQQGVSKDHIRHLLNSIAEKDDLEVFSALSAIDVDHPNAISNAGFDGIRHNVAEDDGQPTWAVRRPSQINPTLLSDMQASPIYKKLADETGKIDLTGQTGVKPQATAPAFYNKAIRVLEERVPQGAKLPPGKFRDLMLGNGVTKGFFDDMGLGKLFEGKKSLSREEVLAYLKENDPQFQEIKLGGAKDPKLDRYNELKAKEDNQIQHDEWGDPDEDLGDAGLTSAEWDELYKLETYFRIKAKGGDPMPKPTEYDQYQLPGQKDNYTELLMGIKDKPEFEQPHFPGQSNSNHGQHANTMGHMRFNTRNVGGKKTLFVEEIQSDLHQQGKEKGYQDGRPRPNFTHINSQIERQLGDLHKPLVNALGEMDNLGFDNQALARQAIIRNPDFATRWDVDPQHLPTLTRFRELIEARQANETAHGAHNNKVPDYPFKQNWHELMLKRAIREGAEQGAEQIGWTTGDQQANRYPNLNAVVSELKWVPDSEVAGRGTLEGKQVDGRPYRQFMNDQATLESHVGEAVAKRLLAHTEGVEPRFDITVATADGGGPHVFPNQTQSAVRNMQERYGGPMYKLDIVPTEGRSFKEYPTLTGQQLDLGIGPGMRAFYDKLLPGFFNKYGKGHGSKAELKSAGRYSEDYSADLLKEAEHIEKAQGRYRMEAVKTERDYPNKAEGLDRTATALGDQKGQLRDLSMAEVEQQKQGNVWTAPLTPSLKDLALNKGQEYGKAELGLLLAMAGGVGAAGLPSLIKNVLEKIKQEGEKAGSRTKRNR